MVGKGITNCAGHIIVVKGYLRRSNTENQQCPDKG